MHTSRDEDAEVVKLKSGTVHRCDGFYELHLPNSDKQQATASAALMLDDHETRTISHFHIKLHRNLISFTSDQEHFAMLISPHQTQSRTHTESKCESS